MVMRSLHESASELITTETARFTPSSTEKLARAQALFLYQVIRLFDGDITLRAQAERDSSVLAIWLSDLCKIRDNLGDAALMDEGMRKNQPPKEWEVCLFRPVTRSATEN